MLELFRVWKAGIPVPGMPFSIIWAICASESRCAFGLSAMFGARSPPLPSKPWQLAQVDAKVFSPRVETGLESFSPRFCRRVCEPPANPVATQKAASNASSAQHILALERMTNWATQQKPRAGCCREPGCIQNKNFKPNCMIRRPCRGCESKLAGVNFPRWIPEPGMVEQIERFPAQVPSRHEPIYRTSIWRKLQI
ncbi:MAG: hypothetical protein QOF56_3879 [Acidobacteriaceae bacterium]|nr:hypothetical protein [Acidobacteriaceae bacterium]